MATQEKQRRSSLGTKNSRNNPAVLINSNILQSHFPENKASKAEIGHRAKGKENICGKQRIDNREFPKQVVRFKMNTYQSKKQLNQLIEVQKKSVCPTDRPKHQNSIVNFHNEKLNITFQDDTPKQQSNSKQKTKRKNQSYLKKYKEAISKIFKGLDIFNRGTITETNINKWIPEEALYFLGKVFQQIRQQRLNLSEQQFLQQCLPVLNESSEQDLKQFLQQVNGKQPLHTVSIDYPSEQKNEQSQVEMKIVSEQEKRQQDKVKYQPLIPFQEILGNIKEKERTLNVRLNSIKQKQAYRAGNIMATRIQQNRPLQYSNPQTILHEKDYTKIPYVQQKVELKYSTQKQILQQKSSKQSNYGKWESNSIKVSNFQNKDKEFSNCKQNFWSKNQQKNETTIPHFGPLLSFSQLPTYSKQRQNPHQQVQQGLSTVKIPTQFQAKPKQLSIKNIELAEPFESVPTPLASRIVRQKVTKKQHLSATKRQSSKEQDTSRIDRLSSRLQQYIRFNRQKIEQNRNFIRENSVPKA